MSQDLQAKLFDEPSAQEDKTALQNDGARSSVLVPYPVDKAYDYKLVDEAQVGDYVCVPLGKREIQGVVWGAYDEGGGSEDVKPGKLKSVLSRYDLPPMPAVHREFLNKVASYTLSPLGSVLKMSLSVPSALEPPKPVIGYRMREYPDNALSPQRSKVCDVMADGKTRRAAEIVREAGVSAGVVKGLSKAGVLEEVEMFSAAPCRHPDPSREKPELSAEQSAAADQLKGFVQADSYKAALLDGVTGAGKTEVYFEAVAEALKSDKQVLILLPEIALSNAFLDRFEARFGCAPALWHSNLSAGKRKTTWRGVAMGECKVVVGARSALFLPFADLGLIIVDEEHDPAFKQEDGVIYHARDMAVLRAHMGGFPIVLVSATPSLETMQNVWDGKYTHIELPARYGGATLPDIHMIDLREDKPERGEFVSPVLRNAVVEALQKGQQALLFLNRRGYAPLTLCRSCGHRMQCPRCTAWLVEHKKTNKLHCHHCDYHMLIPHNCPECQEIDSFAVCGPGVERIDEEMRTYFPDAKIEILASDLAENEADLRARLGRIKAGEIDIIIGTQIIAKGHHFPHLTCVGVVDADLGLNGGELRASERVYQLLHQVAGRAGREQEQGHVYIQSFMPEHRIMQAMVDGTRDGFLQVEAMEREQAHMPPFSRLAGIIVTGRDEGLVKMVSRDLARNAPQGDAIQTLGPAPAPLARLRGKWRYRLLVRADKNIDIQKAVQSWIAAHKIPSTIRVITDIDPQSFY